MKNENYYKELPENYKIVKIIDAKNKKTSIMFTLFSILLTCGLMAIGITILYSIYDGFHFNFLMGFILCISTILYIILHELVHGLFYKIFTHEKLIYGFTLTVAFCGVPNLYVTRKVAIITTLAPFTVFSILFLSLIFSIQEESIRYLFMFLFSIHFGGCIGDLYGAIYMIFNHTKEKMLVNDTGPKQSFYCLERKK